MLHVKTFERECSSTVVHWFAKKTINNYSIKGVKNLTLAEPSVRHYALTCVSDDVFKR